MNKNIFIVLLTIVVIIIGVIVIKQEWPNIFYEKENNPVIETNIHPTDTTLNDKVEENKNNQESNTNPEASVEASIETNNEQESKPDEKPNPETKSETHNDNSSVKVNKKFFDVSKYTIDANRSSDPAYNNNFVMPDIYNTGYTSRYEDLVDFDKKYPGVGCTITASNAAKYNYTFEGFKSNCSFVINAVDNITFRNFYIHSDS